jgi:hypothetical protein
MKTLLLNTALIYALAIGISFVVAGLIKTIGFILRSEARPAPVRKD